MGILADFWIPNKKKNLKMKFFFRKIKMLFSIQIPLQFFFCDDLATSYCIFSRKRVLSWCFSQKHRNCRNIWSPIGDQLCERLQLHIVVWSPQKFFFCWLFFQTEQKKNIFEKKVFWEKNFWWPDFFLTWDFFEIW